MKNILAIGILLCALTSYGQTVKQNYYSTNANPGFGSASVFSTNSTGSFFSGTNAVGLAHALSNALRVARSGDIVRISPGIFMSGANAFVIPLGVTLEGSGADRTILSKNIYSANVTNKAVVFMHVNTTLKDLCVSNSAPVVEFVSPDLAISHSGGVGGELRLERVRVHADVDGFVPLLSGVHLTVIDCDFFVKFDALNIGSDGDGGSADIYNSRITATGGSAIGLHARGVVAADGGVARIYNSIITAIGVGATAETAAVATSDTGRMEIYNSTIIYSNNNATVYGAHNGGGGIIMVNCAFNALGTTVNDFFDDSGAPENNILAYTDSTGKIVGNGSGLSGVVPATGSGTTLSNSLFGAHLVNASAAETNVFAKSFTSTGPMTNRASSLYLGGPTIGQRLTARAIGLAAEDNAGNSTNFTVSTLIADSSVRIRDFVRITPPSDGIATFTDFAVTGMKTLMLHTGSGISNGVNGLNVVNNAGALTNVEARASSLGYTTTRSFLNTMAFSGGIEGYTSEANAKSVTTSQRNFYAAVDGVSVASGAGYFISANASGVGDAFALRDNGLTRLGPSSGAYGNGTAGNTSGSLSLSNVSSQRLNLSGGVTANSGGIKHARVTTGSIVGAATALVTVTWGTPFADDSYSVSASVVDATTSSLALSVVHVESVTANDVTVRVLNNAVGSLTGTVHVIAVHD